MLNSTSFEIISSTSQFNFSDFSQLHSNLLDARNIASPSRDMVLLARRLQNASLHALSVWLVQRERIREPHFLPPSLAAVWCVVAGYLSYSVLDGLADRWIVTYSSPAVIIRLLSASALNAAMTQALLAVVSHDPAYRLHAWILIACILTIAYAVQNFMASNFALEKTKERGPLQNSSLCGRPSRPRVFLQCWEWWGVLWSSSFSTTSPFSKV